MDVLTLTVAEFASISGDHTHPLPGGWHLSINRAIPSQYDTLIPWASEDHITLSWRVWLHRVPLHEVIDRHVADIVAEWREPILIQVRNYIRQKNEELAVELERVGELEVSLLRA